MREFHGRTAERRARWNRMFRRQIRYRYGWLSREMGG